MITRRHAHVANFTMFGIVIHTTFASITMSHIVYIIPKFAFGTIISGKSNLATTAFVAWSL
jgi:nitrogen fixation protein FixH